MSLLSVSALRASSTFHSSRICAPTRVMNATAARPTCAPKMPGSTRSTRAAPVVMRATSVRGSTWYSTAFTVAFKTYSPMCSTCASTRIMSVFSNADSDIRIVPPVPASLTFFANVASAPEYCTRPATMCVFVSPLGPAQCTPMRTRRPR